MNGSRIGWLLVALLGLVFGGCVASQPQQVEKDLVNGVSAYRDGGGKSGLVGRVILKESGAAVAGAYVNIYPDTLSNLLGPSQYISQPTAADGSFEIELPQGRYYIVARKRISGEPSGPLSPGDYYSEHKRIVATVEAGKFGVVDLEVVPMKAPMFFKKTLVEKKTTTGIRGTLLDKAGKPVPGSFAIAYSGADMQRLPDYASTLSDGQGEFTIYLPKGGTYYLAARVHAWDMPRPGELYGRYGGNYPLPVKVADESFVEGLTIVLSPFTGTYKQGKSRRPYCPPARSTSGLCPRT